MGESRRLLLTHRSEFREVNISPKATVMGKVTLGPGPKMKVPPRETELGP